MTLWAAQALRRPSPQEEGSLSAKHACACRYFLSPITTTRAVFELLGLGHLAACMRLHAHVLCDCGC